MVRTARVAWSGGEVTANVVGDGPVGILLAHGAGTNQSHPFMVLLRDGLAENGYTVMTFNYAYTERGSKSPDRAERLIEVHAAAAEYLSQRTEEMFLAGRSMGGRIGTYLVAQGMEASGLILYAYPLHPAGRPDKLRVEQFAEIDIPMLFFQGTRDALSRMELFDVLIRPLPTADVEILEGATHGTKGGGGWTAESMGERLISVSTSWISKVSSGKEGSQRA
ncbi:MAG: alpha/beta family hydrolase [Acidimicrobiia bacterium]